MLENIKRNPMMFKDLGAAVYMGTNPEKTKAMFEGKDYTGAGDNSKKSMATFRNIMKSLGYGYDKEEED